MADEPKNLDPLTTNPARRFHVADESDIIADIRVEYRGGGWWRATLDNGGDPRKRETAAYRSLSNAQRWAAATMEEQADEARATCAAICGTDGQDTSGNGNFACGVLSPHGVSIGVCDGNGNDVTQDYYLNGM